MNSIYNISRTRFLVFFCVIGIAFSSFWMGLTSAPAQEKEKAEKRLDDKAADSDQEKKKKADDEEEEESTKARLLTAKKFQLKQEYAVHIEVLKRVSKIDKKQAMKLTIAAKVQSGKQAEKWMKKWMKEFGKQVFGPEDKNKKGKEEQEIEIKDADEIDKQSLQFLAFGLPFSVAKGPTEQREWIKTLNQVLTKEQLAAFEKFNAERDARYHKNQLLHAVGVVSRNLMLTEKQSAEISKLLEPEIKKIKEPASAFYSPYHLFYRLTKIDQKKFDKILTQAQTQQLKLFICPYRAFGDKMEQEAENAEKLEKEAAEK